MTKTLPLLALTLALGACGGSPSESVATNEAEIDQAAIANPPQQTIRAIQKYGTTSLGALKSPSVTSGVDPGLVAKLRLQIDGLTNVPLQGGPSTLGIPSAGSTHVTTNNPAFSGWSGLGVVDNAGANEGMITPPDQALCAGNGLVVEAINNTLAVTDPFGNRFAPPASLTAFFQVPPIVTGQNPVDFVSDPKCLFDAATGSWFVTEVLVELNVDWATGSSTIAGSKIDLAVTQNGDPTGTWNLYSIDVTDDGTNGTPKHLGCPCLSDQPLIGADANGFYVSTNEFANTAPFFNGAQILALSKTALAAGRSPSVVHLANLHLAEFYGISVQPAITPSGDFTPVGNGTEYFMSSLDFSGSLDNRLAVWALTNTATLSHARPSVNLVHSLLKSEVYGIPAPANQKAGPTPLRDCINAGQCPDVSAQPNTPFPEQTISTNDDRMNQVTFEGNVLWGGLNTVLKVRGQQQAGIAYFAVAPFLLGSGHVGAAMAKQGYLGVAGNNVLYPSIGTPDGERGILAFSISGNDYYPSSAYTFLTISLGTHEAHIAGAGLGPQDDFSGYGLDASGNPTATPARWGDYSAAVNDGNTVYFSSEYIPAACTELTCAGREKNVNFGTFVSQVNLDELPF